MINGTCKYFYEEYISGVDIAKVFSFQGIGTEELVPLYTEVSSFQGV